MFGVLSCNQGPVMRGQIAGLSKLAGQAERNGAIRCAPRELALAKSHLKFAELELDQGFVSRASHHLAIAEPNAHAAYDLSPPETCAERGLVIAAPPEDQDTDGDGIMDSRDQCILEPEDKDGYLDEDGCPEIDNDLDGILDTADKCPNDPEDPDGFEDADGCPDPDNDKDTVLDVDDQCPNEPGPPDGDRPGCPRKPALVVVTDKEIKITQQIHFEFDKDIIRPESFPILDAVAEVLQKNPDMRIEIQGHTDNKGSAKYNAKLSDRRAASVRKYLVSHGVAADRLVSHGYGLSRPLVPNDTEQNRALNRRVQFMRTEGGQTP
jgi:outer membrane protein OmpA-like peptidoglycan-associated protein